MTNLFRSGVVAVSLLALAGCSGVGFRADTGGVEAINSVAIVSFVVPEFVMEKAESGGLSGVTALISVGKKVASGEKATGNGQQVAQTAAEGFAQTMAQDTKKTFVPMATVTGNAQFQALATEYGKTGTKYMAAPGLPVILLEMKTKHSDFAAKAAKALGVDGVVIVFTRELEYALYTGAMGTGEAKAEGSGLFIMFDRDGNAVWESGTVVRSEASAAMVAGALDPRKAETLHKDIGATMAKDLWATYTKETK